MFVLQRRLTADSASGVGRKTDDRCHLTAVSTDDFGWLVEPRFVYGTFWNALRPSAAVRTISFRK